MEDVKYGYMCMIDFDYELGHAMVGSIIYPTMEDLRRAHPMIDDCGAVKVKIELEKVIIKGRKL